MVFIEHEQFVVLECGWCPLRLRMTLRAVAFDLLMNKIYGGHVTSLTICSYLCFKQSVIEFSA